MSRSQLPVVQLSISETGHVREVSRMSRIVELIDSSIFRLLP